MSVLIIDETPLPVCLKEVDNEEMCFRGNVGIELINKNLQM